MMLTDDLARLVLFVQEVGLALVYLVVCFRVGASIYRQWGGMDGKERRLQIGRVCGNLAVVALLAGAAQGAVELAGTPLSTRLLWVQFGMLGLYLYFTFVLVPLGFGVLLLGSEDE